MARKITAISFLLSAYILLLAHAVIPHYHHHHESTHDHADHVHDVPHHEHERNGDQDENATLLLDQEIVLRFSQQRINIHEIAAQCDHNLILDAGLISGYCSLEYLPVLVSDASIPLGLPSHLLLYRVYCGLRGPPSV